MLEQIYLYLTFFLAGTITSFIVLKWNKYYVDINAIYRAAIYATHDMLSDGRITPLELYRLINLLEDGIKRKDTQTTILNDILGMGKLSVSEKETIEDIKENIIEDGKKKIV